MKKKFLTLAVCLCMLLSLFITVISASDTTVITVEADKAKAAPGETVNFTVTVGPISELGSASFELELPAGLEYVAGSGKLPDGLNATLGMASTDWTESALMWSCYGNIGGFASNSNTVVLTFSCVVADDAALVPASVSLTMVDLFKIDDETEIEETIVPAVVSVEIPPVPATGVTLDTAALALKTGESKTLVATVAPDAATNKALTWKSSDETVATVVDGTVTAIKAGTATITVTTVDGGFTAECVVTVTCAEHVDADGQINFDGSKHYYVCSCGTEFGAEEHKGGTKTCKDLPVCTACGQPYGTLADHDYTFKSNEAVAKKATCVSKAVYYFACTMCKEIDPNKNTYEAGEVDPTNHVGITPVSEVPFGCETDGVMAYYTCTCGKNFTDAEGKNVIADLDAWKAGEGKIPAAHKLGTIISEAPAVHTKDELAAGMKAHHICSVCGKYFDENKVATTKDALVIPKPEHKFEGAWISAEEKGHAKACSCGLLDTPVKHTPNIPAPTEDDKQICDGCGYVIAQELGHLCHKHLTFVKAEDAWCEKEGNIAYYVCDCGKYYLDADAKNETNAKAVVLAALEHIPVISVCYDEVMYEGSRHAYVCDRCLKQLSTPEEHYSTGANVATCTKVAVCDVCGEICGEKLDHNYVDYDVKTPEGHAKACTYGCGTTTTPESHVDDATGEFCDVCKFVYHTCGGKEVTLVKAVPATCTVDGVKAYYACSCGKFYADEAATTEIADLDAWKTGEGKVPAEHKVVTVEGYEATCTATGLSDDSYCSVCKEVYSVATVIPATGHDWTAWVTVKVEGENRYQERYCACGAKEESAITPEHKHELVKVEAVAPTCETNGNIEYWYCKTCDWMETIGGVAVNSKSVILPAAHDLEHFEAKDATCLELGNIEYWACKNCDRIEVAGGVLSNIKAVQLPTLDHTIEHVAAVAVTCTTDGNVEYWYCTTCGYAWLDEARTLVSNLQSVKLGAAHALVHVEAKASDCYEMGNIEYWYCTNCDWVEVAGGVASNLKAVKLPTTEHNIEHVAAKAATCESEGNVEYWYCTNCGYAWLDEARTLVSNLQSVKLGAAHTLVKVDAKAPTCFEMGNIEYWYCSACDWVEVAGGVASNLKAVQLPVTHNIVHVAAVAPTATENGNIEYWYCKDCGYAWLDEFCTKNTNLKAVILPATGENNPDTGDNAIFFAVALVAVATLGTAVITFKKKREN